MLNAPVPGLVPAPAPAEASLHPLAVQVQANQPVNPRTLLGAFGQIFEDAGSLHTAERETLALVVGTSGSTGTPKRTALTARALAASAEATVMGIGQRRRRNTATRRTSPIRNPMASRNELLILRACS